MSDIHTQSHPILRNRSFVLLLLSCVQTCFSQEGPHSLELIISGWVCSFLNLILTFFLLCYSGLCTGRPAWWFSDVCQEATRHGPASQPDGGGRPAARFPQLSAALQGDGGGFWHLREANKKDFPQGQSGSCASATSKPGRHLYEQQFISLTQLCRFS